ncbi:MAG TPA: hypothetical protein VGX70_04590 [Gemmataceae bacterium]|jgi:hypothetical protein|nr:hypothetical protein [Gemmataceae bacterium]
MMRAKVLLSSLALVSAFFTLATVTAFADDKKSALSGVWVMKEGEPKIEFADKKVVKIFPHGDNKVIVVVCEYAVEKDHLVKAKITDFEGTDEAKKMVKELLPLGTEFSFQWKVKNDSAKLDDLKGDKVEHMKSHLEGAYSQMK